MNRSLFQFIRGFNKPTHFLSFTLTMLLIFISATVFGQGQANKWYFGDGAALDFNSGSPVFIPGSAMSAIEGSSSVADAAGNLLFYTDGMKVWDKTNTQMPNGAGLLGGASSTQAALIVPQPGSSTVYYVFTSGEQAGLLPSYPGMCYSIVDMSLNGGNGDVLAAGKNTPLLDSTCEKLTAVKNCMGNFWIIAHRWNSDAFYAYLLSPTGVSTSPVISHTGIINAGPSGSMGEEAIGYLKASPDGKKLAAAVSYADIVQFAGKVQLFDFDKTTGIVSNPITITYPPPPPTNGENAPYGIEFSPDNKKLYVSVMNGGSTGSVYQYDISSNVQATIIASQYTVVQDTVFYAYAGLQLAPDGRIYIALTGPDLAAINNPDVLGSGCNFVQQAVSLGNAICILGLPNFAGLGTTAAPLSPVITSNANSPCASGSVVLDAGSGYSSYLWMPGGATTQTFAATASGIYTVTVSNLCGTGSGTITVNIPNGTPLSLSATSAATSCGKNNGTASIAATGGTAPYTYNWSSSAGSAATAGGLAAGTYTCTVTDALGCVQTHTVSIAASLAATASAGADVSIDYGNSITLNAGGGSTYSWSPSGGLSCISCASPVASPAHTTVYCVTATDAAGCIDTACVKVSVEYHCDELFVPNAFSPNNDHSNDLECVYGNCIVEINFKIYDRWGEKVFETNEPKTCWDGTYKASPLNTAMFAYYLEATLITGESITKKGHIKLIR